MAFIEFKNLPDKTTPINSKNLNLLQEKIEEKINDVETELKKATTRLLIFNGEGAMGNPITINKTWTELGKFKNLIVEVADTSINSYTNGIISYDLMSSGNNLNSNKRNVNVFVPVYIGSDRNNFLHLIPNSTIGTNTIQFDGISDSAVVKRMWIEY